MNTNEMMEKILFQAKIERERAFLDDARLFLIDAINSCKYERADPGIEMDCTKIKGLVERMICAELEYLDQEPEAYLEMYED